MKFRRYARVWRWFAVSVFVGLVVWRSGPTSFTVIPNHHEAAGHGSNFGQWTFVGPTHIFPTGDPTAYSGRVTSIAVNPANPNHWLIGAAMGGVWETVDAGATWQPRTDGQPSLAIGAIAFSPTSPNVVYAGTGEANFVPVVLRGQRHAALHRFRVHVERRQHVHVRARVSEGRFSSIHPTPTSWSPRRRAVLPAATWAPWFRRPSSEFRSRLTAEEPGRGR